MKFTFPILLLSLSRLFSGSLAVEVEGPPLELTGEETYFIAPRWSPDGATLAVTGRNYRGIYLLSFPEGDVTPISEEPAAGLAIRWSPAGDRILSIVSRYENRRRYNAVAVFDVNSGRKHLLTDFQTDPTGAPSWSRDGKQIFLAGSKDILLFDSERKEKTTDPSSPSSETIVTSHKEEIIIYELPEKRRMAFEAVKGGKLNLTVSPDGKSVAFEIMGGHLWVTGIDGKNAVDLGIGYRPSWSPGSDRITYMITSDDGHQYLSSDIYAVNADGSGKVNITKTEKQLEMSPTWSPDGKWIAYHTLNEGKILVQEVR
ncbi:MAG: hypothetical protein V3U24_07445 [Candidatus Neomarinimicrobiota bacterium]